MTVAAEVSLIVDLEHDRTVNYAMQQNHVPFVKRLRLTNTSTEDLASLTLTLHADPDFATEAHVSIAASPAGSTVDLGSIDVMLSPTFLASLTERVAGTLTIMVASAEQQLYLRQWSIDVLAYDEWNGTRSLPEIIAAFIMPNHPEVSRLLRKAADVLRQWTSDGSLNGYRSKNPSRVRAQIAAIYEALRAEDIAYCVPPASFEAEGQKIRTPDAIRENRLGTCLDLAVLFAACAEAAGLHPLIVFSEGHAFPGAWLVEESFAESIQDDVTLLTKRIAPGMQEICVVEATAFTNSVNASFEQAVALADANLAEANQFHFFVDVRRARASHIRPIPLRMSGRSIEDADESTPSPASSPPEDLTSPITFENEQGAVGERTRLEQWQRRLLDLSLRNPLINFRPTGANIPLLTAELHELEDALAAGQDFQIHPRPLDWEATARDATVFRRRMHSDPEVQLLREEFQQSRLRADLAEKELGTRLTQLYRAARTSIEENGANTLFLALGTLVWYETDSADKPRYAPILLIPMEIVRKSVRSGFVVREGEDEPLLNVTLTEMLHQDYGIDIPGLSPLPADAHGVDVLKILTAVRRAVMHKTRWDVLDQAYLGLFSFSKFVMWHDIKARAQELKRNKVVASLMAGSVQWTDDNAVQDSIELDRAYHPKDLLCPISADSSQQAAILAAGQSRSVILHGPPGTGKSQTITNTIAHVLSQGKTVLFVAEKMAALSVVQRRLKQIGLAPFCLEVHSKKSKKREVLEQLRACLELGSALKPQNWEQDANRLAQLRDELNGYVTALHRDRQIGHSIFHGLSRLATVRHAPDVVVFQPEQVQELAPGKLRSWTELARQVRVAGEGCGHPSGHAWAAARCQDYSPRLRTATAQAIQTFHAAIEKWRDTSPPVALLFQTSESENSYALLSALLGLAEHFLAIPPMPDVMLREADWDNLRDTLDSWIAHGRARDRLRGEVFARYSERVTELDPSDLREALRRGTGQWFIPRWLTQRKVSNQLRAAMTVKTGLAADQLASEVEPLRQLREEEAVLTSASTRARELFGNIWRDGNPDWDQVAGGALWAGEVRRLASAIAGPDLVRAAALRAHCALLVSDGRAQLGPETVLGRQLAAFAEAGADAMAAWQKLSELLVLEPAALLGDRSTSDWFTATLAQIGRWQEGLDDLKDWCGWVRVRAQAIEAGLSPVVAPYEQGKLANAEVEDAFLRGLYEAWSAREIAQDANLASFSRVLFEDKIRQFRELDETFLQLTGDEIYARLAARIPPGQGALAQTSEMGILGRELQKQRNHMALRALFQKIPNVLTRLKPCLLMSPISVAQYLDPSHLPFDLVIFDEASQVPTCDAVGAIARGKEALIVGDDKQLPPTTFFTRMNLDEDEEDGSAVQDLESILDDCLAFRMPSMHLLWHYRSRHESLIAFSNHQYYNNGLLTFPSPDDLLPRVRYCYVAGIYDRGRSKQNRVEAEAVVGEVLRRLRDPESSKQSIGVVTFNQAQQQLIEDLLDEQRRQMPELERFFSDEAIEPVFVKNLENVQGDERDVVLFSIGYGPDPQGRVSMNFGPVNKEGGWRRLNVAVSRSRQEMMVFTSLSADQLDVSRTSAKGVADLKAFLEYAELGKQALYAQRAVTPNGKAESSFEEQVCQALRAKGHRVDMQVGCSGYRIDLAVVAPNQPGRYLLGIECDGSMYHRALTARDRDKLRESVLRQLGWQIHRVWSTDWWENAEREIKRIEEAIGKASGTGFSVASAPPVDPPQPVRIGAPASQPAGTSPRRLSQAAMPLNSPPASTAKPYVVCQLAAVTRAHDTFYDRQSNRTIASQIRLVVSEEGPISHSLLCRRIVDAWRLTKIGSRIDARIREVRAGLNLKTSECGGVTYYWPEKTSPEKYRAFRVPGSDITTRRAVEDIPPEEVANAANEVLRRQVALPEADLIREVARLFGFQRTGPALEQKLSLGIDHLVRRGDAKRDGEGQVVQAS